MNGKQCGPPNSERESLGCECDGVIFSESVKTARGENRVAHVYLSAASRRSICLTDV